MKRTIAIKLTISESQREAPCELQDLFTKGCNEVASVAFSHKERNRNRLHHLCYYSLRKALPSLGSQMCCNVIAKTAACLKALKRPKELLFKHGCSVHFDKRTYSLKNGILSLFTVRGRIRIPLERAARSAISALQGRVSRAIFQVRQETCRPIPERRISFLKEGVLQISEYHKGFLDFGVLKEAELVSKGKRWFFHLVLDLPDVMPMENGKTMGVDLGENVLAATSTGKLFGGGALRAERDRFLGVRKRLQSNGSQSAKQQLRYISGREKRHVRYMNHCISKQIVQEAQRNGCSTLVMEDLKNIRERIKAGKKLRSRLHRWSFDQLRQFIEYKAMSIGITIQYVSPEYTSQTCSRCLCLGARKKHRFSCFNCGSLQHSDLNASQNILRLGLSADRPTGDVNRRYVAVSNGQ